MTAKTRLNRIIKCDLLNLHIGNVETALVDTERDRLTIHYMKCSRCGVIQPLDMEPRHETEYRLGL